MTTPGKNEFLSAADDKELHRDLIRQLYETAIDRYGIDSE